MKRKVHSSTIVPSSVNVTSNTNTTTSPSSPSLSLSPSSSSSSSSSSCILDSNNNIIIVNNQKNVQEEEKQINKPKRVRKRKSINGIANHESPLANPPTNRRTSIYRGVTRHRWTGRYEAHLWDKSSWNNIQNKKGRQVYLGAYDSELDAARTYDLAALKYWGTETTLNFHVKNYTKELEEMQNASKEEYLASLRRRSSGFSRGVSKYRGVARHHHNGRWEARIGRVLGNKYLYLGTFSSQEEAAAAYDLAAIEYRGANAVTNFDISNYIGHAKNLMPKTESPPSPSQTENMQPQQLQQPSVEQQVEKEERQDEELKSQAVQPVQQEEQTAMPSQFAKSKITSSIQHSSMLEMDDPEVGRENPWSFCLEIGGYDPLVVPDIPLEEDGKLLDLFDQSCFEDNIDLIFEGEGNFISLDSTYIDGLDDIGGKSSINSSENCDKNVELLPKMDNLLSFYPTIPSATSSTTSLVSCQL